MKPVTLPLREFIRVHLYRTTTKEEEYYGFPNTAILGFVDIPGTLVIVAGGEVGTLQEWWNAPDKQEWRWSLEFYNHR